MPSDTPVSRPPHRGLALAALVLAVLAGVTVFNGIAARNSQAALLRDRVETVAVPTVALVKPLPPSAMATLDLPGRIEAFARAPLYARVSGYLKGWYVDIGGAVKAGQLLADIETPDLDQQLLQAQAELASARSNLALATSTAKRWQALLSTDAVSRQEAEEKSGDVNTKQAVVNALQANVDRFQTLKRFTRIVAPFDGVVTARNTDVGALISVGGAVGSELFVVSDTRKLRVYVSLPQSYVSGIKRGSKAQISTPESPGQSQMATVQAMSQSINASSGSMLIQLTADNPGSGLIPGGFASVRFEMPRAPGTLSIPPGALMFGKKGLRVATVDQDNKVVIKAVTIARDLGASVEIASGLSADDRVIESPPDGIAQGDQVKLAEPTAKAERAKP